MQAFLTCELYLTTTGTSSCGKSILMIRQVFETSENIYALNILKEFFDFYGLQPALQNTEQMINYSLHRKFYKKTSPYNFVFFGDCLFKLISACMVLSKEANRDSEFKAVPMQDGMPDLGRTEDYMPAGKVAQWDYLPRHLSVQQYLEPMAAFHRLRKYKTEQEWSTAISEMVEYALSTASIHGCLPPYNMMKMRRILLQVLEAGHLVLVRNGRRRRDEL